MKLIQYIFLDILNANLKSVYPFFVSRWRYAAPKMFRVHVFFHQTEELILVVIFDLINRQTQDQLQHVN